MYSWFLYTGVPIQKNDAQQQTKYGHRIECIFKFVSFHYSWSAPHAASQCEH